MCRRFLQAIYWVSVSGVLPTSVLDSRLNDIDVVGPIRGTTVRIGNAEDKVSGKLFLMLVPSSLFSPRESRAEIDSKHYSVVGVGGRHLDTAAAEKRAEGRWYPGLRFNVGG